MMPETLQDCRNEASPVGIEESEDSLELHRIYHSEDTTNGVNKPTHEITYGSTSLLTFIVAPFERFRRISILRQCKPAFALPNSERSGVFPRTRGRSLLLSETRNIPNV